MAHPAENLHLRNASSKTATQVVGDVMEVDDGRLRVRTDLGELDARRAVSCLVEPEVGDEVLVSMVSDGRAFVLAVLERDEAGATVSVDGDMRLRARGGALALAGTAVSLLAGKLSLRAVEGDVAIDRVTHVGQRVAVEVDRMRLAAASAEGVFDRLVQRAKRAYRRVEDLDQLEAGRIDQRADATMRLHAEHTLMTADVLVKVDADQIHMG